MSDKKELKKQYKQTAQLMGIYQIRNKVNGKLLIGSAMNLPGKINSNKFQLKLRVHKNPALQKDYDEFGVGNFEFEVLDRLEPAGDLNQDYTSDLAMLEEMWLEKLMPYGDRGYHKQKT